MNTTHPLSQLTAAEAALIATIHAAADRLDAVGTADLEAALVRLQTSAIAAADRLSRASKAVGFIVSELLGDLATAAAGIAGGLDPAVGAERPAAEPARGAVHPDVRRGRGRAFNCTQTGH